MLYSETCSQNLPFAISKFGGDILWHKRGASFAFEDLTSSFT